MFSIPADSVWSDRNRAEYGSDGVTLVKRLISPAAAAALLAEVRQILAHPGPFAREHENAHDQGRFHVNIMLYTRSCAFRQLAFNSAAATLAKQVLRTNNVHFFYDQLFYKAPRTRSRTQWHQDLPFWPLKGVDIPSIWIALTDAAECTSAVQYVVGSHLWGQFYAPENPSERSLQPRNASNVCPDYHLPPLRERVKIQSYRVEPGDAVVHHPLIIHGAGSNESDSQERAAVSLRYCGPDVEWDERPNTMYFPFTAGRMVTGVKFSDQAVFNAI